MAGTPTLARTAPASPAPTPAAACVDLGTEPVTLAALIDRALCANVDTRSAWQRIRGQQAQVGVARAAFLPSLDASASQRRQLGDRAPGSDPDQTGVSLSASWLLWDFGGRRANLAQARQTLAALQAGLDSRSQQIAQAAIAAYFRQLAASAALQAADASVTSAAETVRAASQRLRVGLGTRAELLQAETALAQARLLQIQRAGELAAGAGALAVTAGYEADRAIRLVETLPEPARSPAPPALATLLAEARQRHPDRLAQLASRDAAESELDRLAAQRLPQLSVSASRSNTRDSDGRIDSGQVALTATVPLFTGGRQTWQEEAARSSIALADIAIRQTEQQISLAVWQAWHGLVTTRARVDASDQLLASASEATRAALARYQAGLGDLLTLLRAQDDLADARQQQARARHDWAAARLELARASGLLIRDPDPLLSRPDQETTP